MLDLPGRIAIVTGAGSIGPGWGNGKATAVLLARQGAKIFAIDIDAAAAAETRSLIEEEGGECATHACDMTQTSEVKAAVDACMARYGGIDILVNNVGGSAAGDPVTMTEDVWDTQVDFNLKTAFLGCKHVLPIMERQASGVVINISSIAGLRQHVNGRVNVAYSATKAGLIGLSNSVAMKYVRKGIRCNTVVIGVMHTPLVEQRLVRQLGADDAAALIAQRHAQVPMGRMGDAWDAAHAVLFLVSDEARYITGTEIVVDGGISAARP
ncbi:MAG TPA: SDR family NAD(P)-dependent oxidoreductase [Burkholderiales bacterium]|nr:SDR family NAD(P)-dependent oxidoreductase [Burkholderiales bacterium]